MRLKLEDHGNKMNSGSKVIQTYINYGKFLKYLFEGVVHIYSTVTTNISYILMVYITYSNLKYNLLSVIGCKDWLLIVTSR